MLGFVVNAGQGALDGLLADVEARLRGRGLRLAGAIQSNHVFDPGRRCHMDLTLLDSGETVRISQDRGRHARGCRLDSGGLAQAVARVEAALEPVQPDLLIINKFGKAELEGGGFRGVIAKALLAAVPVLTTVSQGQRAGFLAFAEDLATELPARPDRVVAWCLARHAGLAA